MKKLLIFALAATLMWACSKQTSYDSAKQMVEEASAKVNMLTPQQLHDLMGSEETYTLIDVRQEIEHYYGFIPGSINIPRGSMEFKIADSTYWDSEGLYMPAKDEKIVVYCKKGDRGILTAFTLMQLGYTNVWVLEGGWKNWEIKFPDIYEKNLEKLGGDHAAPSKGSGGC